MSLGTWFRWLLGGGSRAEARQPLRLPTLARAQGARAAQGHWFMQTPRLAPAELADVWSQCAAQARQRWLVVDPMSRLVGAQAQGDWLWRFSPSLPEEIAALLEGLSGAAFDGVLLLDLERMRGLFGDAPEAMYPLWDGIRAALGRGVGVVQVQVLRWRGCPCDDLIPMDELLGGGGRW
jgi:hypothetical protein